MKRLALLILLAGCGDGEFHPPIAEVICPNGVVNSNPSFTIETETRQEAKAVCIELGEDEGIGGCAIRYAPRIWTVVYPKGHPAIEEHERRHVECDSLEHEVNDKRRYFR